MVAGFHMSEMDQALVASLLKRACSRVRTLKGRSKSPGCKVCSSQLLCSLYWPPTACGISRSSHTPKIDALKSK